MFYTLFPYLITVLAVFTDISVIPFLLTGSWIFPLTLCTVMSLAMVRGRIHGLLFALTGGLMIDILTGYPLGYMTLSYISCAWLCGLFGYESDESRLLQDYSPRKAALRRIILVLVVLFLFEAVTLVYRYFHTAYVVWRDAGSAAVRIALSTLSVLLLRSLLMPLRYRGRGGRSRVETGRGVRDL